MRDPDAFLVARLRFKHLALIEALGRLNSIRKAARAIHVSEPAVSKALAEVETSFGCTLFVRSSTGVTPTVRGLTVIEGARQLLNSLHHLRLAAASAEQILSIRLGANPFVAQTFLPQLVRTMRAQVEHLHLDLQEGRAPALLQQLRDGEIDAMLVTLSPNEVGNRQQANLVVRQMYTETLSVIVPKGHPLARRRSVRWHELTSEHWILPSPPSAVHAAVVNAFLSQGLAPPAPWMLSAPPQTNVRMVAAGLGLSAVPTPFAAVARKEGAVDVVRVEPQAKLSPVSLVFRAAATQEPGITTLCQALESILPR